MTTYVSTTVTSSTTSAPIFSEFSSASLTEVVFVSNTSSKPTRPRGRPRKHMSSPSTKTKNGKYPLDELHKILSKYAPEVHLPQEMKNSQTDNSNLWRLLQEQRQAALQYSPLSNLSPCPSPPSSPTNNISSPAPTSLHSSTPPSYNQSSRNSDPFITSLQHPNSPHRPSATECHHQQKTEVERRKRSTEQNLEREVETKKEKRSNEHQISASSAQPANDQAKHSDETKGKIEISSLVEPGFLNETESQRSKMALSFLIDRH
eukprot:TRINITY_DN12535_c0_g1_i1.p1 TRINITY_DN12535_c0_g1~~TRINITY_DN12535_c0_g1_i1.p1  ORF type:complete len:300 (-),score=60.94 TRINITY_DN12535_c0_g1_i1:139-924(-)